MAQIQLLTGSYQTRSIIAGAQRQINLFGEITFRETFTYFPTPTGPSMVTLYPTPGLTLLASLPAGPGRGAYQTSQNQLIIVVGTGVYYVSPTWQTTLLGTIAPGTSICSMADNGEVLVLVDGTTSGYTLTLNQNAPPSGFGPLVDPTGSFVGATRVQYVNTYFVFNAPGTPLWYCTLSGTTTFDPLYFADKAGYSDSLATICVVQQLIWLIGTQSTEIWYDAGSTDFPFGQVEGSLINHGCAAPYSVAAYDTNVFWLSRDNAGHAIVVMGTPQYATERISQHAIEYAFDQYSTIEDAIGYVYQHMGHVFYVLTFPTGDATWVYDLSTKLWHQWMSADANGNLHRHLVATGCYAYGVNVGVDYSTGALYHLDTHNFTDNGTPIQRIRSFPHMVNDLKRVRYNRFVADIEVGTGSPAADTALGTQPQIFLRMSDDRGATFGEPIAQTMGALGQTKTLVQFRRLGIARDRIFELFWSSPVETALNGAFVDAEPLQS